MGSLCFNIYDLFDCSLLNTLAQRVLIIKTIEESYVLNTISLQLVYDSRYLDCRKEEEGKKEKT